MAVDSKWLVRVGDEVHIKTGMKMVLEAGAEMTLKAGGSWVKLDSAGVWINGSRICLNCGGTPGEGSEADALLPIFSLATEKAGAGEVTKALDWKTEDNPVSKKMENCMNEAADDGAMFVSA